MTLDYRCKAGGKQVYECAPQVLTAAAGWDRGVPSFATLKCRKKKLHAYSNAKIRFQSFEGGDGTTADMLVDADRLAGQLIRLKPVRCIRQGD